MTTIRLTAAQAMVRFLSAQRIEIDGHKHRLFERADLYPPSAQSSQFGPEHRSSMEG